jgi:hypothetical protein
LYEVTEDLTAQAVLLGGRIRETGLGAAVAEAGGPAVLDTIGIQPPSLSGMLLWRDRHGVASLDGMPIMACHWGPLVKRRGVWIVWWCETAVVLALWKAQATPRTPWSSMVSATVLARMGPLYYACQNILSPRGEHTERELDLRTGSGDGENSQDPGGIDPVDPVEVALLHTTIATWELLSAPGAATLTSHPPTPGQIQADRAARLRPRPVIVASTHTATGPGPRELTGEEP